MPGSEDTPAYRVEPDGETCRVLGPAGNAVLETRDAASAAHYAELLERAYRAGYKAGLREGRRRGRGD